MRTDRLGALALLVSLVAPASHAGRPALNPEQARGLVLAALTHKERTLPGIAADAYNDPHSSGFMFFTVVWAAGHKQSVVVGIFAVDPYTADVWSATSACDELTNLRLRALQKRDRQALNITPAEYKRLKTKGPLCE